MFTKGRKVLALMLLSGFLLVAQELRLGTLFYSYTFFWNNADFNSSTQDQDSYTYMHGDVNLTIFTQKLSLFLRIGGWGQFGAHPINLVPPNPNVKILEGYVDFKNLPGNFSLRMGQEKFVYGDGLVVFDGGVDGGTLGATLYTRHKCFDLDLIYRKVQEGAGIRNVLWTGDDKERLNGDDYILALYPTFKFKKFLKWKVSPYVFNRIKNIYKRENDILVEGKDNPIWIGGRIEGQGKKVRIVGEYVKILGKRDINYGDTPENWNYNAYALDLRGEYRGKNWKIGGAYVVLSGDNPTTEENETYFSAVDGPYGNDFYKKWVGFGPAHLMTTPFGFALVRPTSFTMSNLKVYNMFMSYKLSKISFRVDYWKYNRDKLLPQQKNKDMGQELSLLVLYTPSDYLLVGGTAGYWFPGKYMKDDLGLGESASGVFGAYVFFSTSFDFRIPLGGKK